MSAKRGTWAVWIAGAGALLFLLGPGLSLLRVLPGLLGMGLMAAGVILGVAGALVGTVALIRGGRRRRAGVAILLGLTVVVAGLLPASGALDAPRINDVTTDLEDPPQFQTLAALPVHEGFVSEVRAHYAGLDTLILEVPLEEATAAMQRALTELGCETVAIRTGHLEATCETRVFGFVDDVAVRLRDHENGTAVDIRSRSRVGRGDLGKNADRIRELLERGRGYARR